MIKKLLIFFVFIFCTKIEAQPYGASNFTLCSVISPETNLNSYNDKYSSCWGWFQASKNKEYAIAGSTSGTFWIDVTNPYTPTVSCFRPGKITTTVWREMKTYQNYCYVISDDGGPNSFQIFDMQYLPDSVHKVYDGVALFKRAHTVWIDGNNLYACGVTYSNNSTSSMNVYSLATPTNPVLMRKLNQDAAFITYVHDAYVLNDTVYASCGNQELYVFTYSANVFTQIGSLTSYPSSGYNHSSALTPNRKTLVFTDEVPAGLPLKVADVQNISNIQVLATINQYTAGTPHNPFIVNDSLCFMSSYCDGLQLFNIKNPSAPFLAGYFDTFYQGGGNTNFYADPYDGLWSLYPYFPSKNIFALDQLNGVFMLKTDLFANSTSTTVVINPTINIGTGSIPTSSLTPTGINQNNSANSFAINPNPANDKVILTFSGELMSKSFNVELIDVKGQIVFKQNISEMKTIGNYFKEINLTPYDNGIYFLRLSSDNTVLKKSKLIIAR